MSMMCMCAGIDSLDTEFAVAILVREEGRSLHRVVIRSAADAHGGCIICASAQRHALPWNVRTC